MQRINLFNTDEKNVGKLEKMQNYIASYKKSEKFFEQIILMCSIRNGIHFRQSTICF